MSPPQAEGAGPRWGIPDAVVGWVIANAVGLVAGSVILAQTGYLDRTDDLPLSLVAVLQVPLWLGLAGAVLYAGRVKGAGVVADFGVRARLRDAPIGLGLGVAAQLLVPLLYLPIFWVIGERDVSAAARELSDQATDPLGAVLLVGIVAIAAPVVEELFYRGLLLRALERRLGSRLALVISSVAFGGVHGQLLQLPALIVAGFLFGWLAQHHGRLGPAIFAHVGFNAVTVAILLATT